MRGRYIQYGDWWTSIRPVDHGNGTFLSYRKVLGINGLYGLQTTVCDKL